MFKKIKFFQVISDHSGVIIGFETGFPGHNQNLTNWYHSEIGNIVLIC
jgi:hypothetical protein